MTDHTHTALALIARAEVREERAATLRALPTPDRCDECGGALHDGEEGHCGLCFPVTDAQRDYLAAFDSYLYAQRCRPMAEVRQAEVMRAVALRRLVTP